MVTQIADTPKSPIGRTVTSGGRFACTVEPCCKFKDVFTPCYCSPGDGCLGFVPSMVGTIDSGIRVRFKEIDGEYTVLTDSRPAGVMNQSVTEVEKHPQIEVGQHVIAVFECGPFSSKHLVALIPNSEMTGNG